MSWLSDFVSNPGQALSNAGNNLKREISQNRGAVNFAVNPIGSIAGKWADPMGTVRQNMVGNILGQAGIEGFGQNQNQYLNAISGDRAADFAAGRERGDQIFNDQQMKDIQKRKDDLSRGYSGQELGAIRGQARNEIQGQNTAYSQALAGKLARQGVGGARAAAMQGAQQAQANKNLMDFERKLTADNAGLIRAGEQDATDFAMRRKYGGLSTELGYGQLGVNERAGDKALAASNKKEDKGFLGSLLDGIF